MTVTIIVKEVGEQKERTVEVRHVVTESHKRLNALSASRILRREFPEFGKYNSASKSIVKKNVYFAMHSVKPSKKCNFHYIWKHYYLADDSEVALTEIENELH